MQWRFTSKVEDVLDTDLLRLSMKRIKIQGEFIKWTNVATAILKGAAQSTSLRELQLETPEEFPPPQEVIDDVRKAKPELRLVVMSGSESVSNDITWHYKLLVHCPTCCMSHVPSCVWVVWGGLLVRSCEQLLYWRRDLPSLHRGKFNSLASTDRHTHSVAWGSVDLSHTLSFRCGRKACCILVCAESEIAYIFFLLLYCYWSM